MEYHICLMKAIIITMQRPIATNSNLLSCSLIYWAMLLRFKTWWGWSPTKRQTPDLHTMHILLHSCTPAGCRWRWILAWSARLQSASANFALFKFLHHHRNFVQIRLCVSFETPHAWLARTRAIHIFSCKLYRRSFLTFLYPFGMQFGFVSSGLQRNGKSCRLRWINYLRPGLKRGMFSQEEEDVVINLQAKLGNK